MTSQSGPLSLINRHHYPANVLCKRFTFAQFGEVFSDGWRDHVLLFKLYLATHMVCRNYPAAGFCRQALDRRYQLAHITGPGVTTEQLKSFFLEFGEGVIVRDKDRNIRGMLSEGRSSDRISVQAIIQVAAEAPLIDFTAEILVGCGDEAYIYLDSLRPSDSPEPAFLQDA